MSDIEKPPLADYFMLFLLEAGRETLMGHDNTRLSDTIESPHIYQWEQLQKEGYMYYRTDENHEYMGLTDKAMNLIKRKAKQDE